MVVIKNQLRNIHGSILSTLDVEVRNGIGRHVHSLQQPKQFVAFRGGDRDMVRRSG